MSMPFPTGPAQSADPDPLADGSLYVADGRGGTRTIAPGNAPYVRVGSSFADVRNYGAVLDADMSAGTGTDDTAAITAALAAADCVYVPGFAKITTHLDVRNKVLFGDDRATSGLSQATTADAILYAGGGHCQVRDLWLKHFTISGLTDVPNGVGIRLENASDGDVFERLNIQNVTCGIYSYEPIDALTNYTYSTSFRDIRIQRFKHSAMFFKGSGAGNTGCVWDNIYIVNKKGDGTHESSLYGAWFEGFDEGSVQQLNLEHGDYGYGVVVNGCDNFDIASLHFEGYTANANFQAFIFVQNSLTGSVTMRAVTLKNCTLDDSKAANYALLRLSNTPRVHMNGVYTVGSTVTGTPVRRKVYSDPATAGAYVVLDNYVTKDNVFNTADFFNPAPTINPVRVNAYHPEGLVSAKGSILVATAAGVITEQAVGTDDYALVADSAQTNGIKYKSRSRSVADIHADTTITASGESTLGSLAIPTTVVAGDVLRFAFAGDQLNNSGGAVNYTYTLYVGATAIGSFGAVSASATANRRKWRVNGELIVVLPASSQYVQANGLIGAAGSGAFTFGGVLASGSGNGTSAEDLTAGKSITLKVTLGTAGGATLDSVIHSACLELSSR